MQFACSVSAFFVFYTWVNPYVHLNNIRNFNLWRVHLQGVSLFQYTKLSKNPVSSFHSDLPLNLNKILFWRNLKSLFKKYSIWIYFFGLLVKTVLSALTISHELFWVTKKWQSKKIFFSTFLLSWPSWQTNSLMRSTNALLHQYILHTVVHVRYDLFA